jgi:hypothetical protein
MSEPQAPEPATPQSKIARTLGQIGLTGERRALALFILSLFTCYFLLLALVMQQQMPEWFPAFIAMFGMYAIAFFGVASGWFWGRWVAIGLGYWGLTIAGWGIVQMRELSPPLVILGVTHGLIALLLSGDSMAAYYEGRPEWRARFGIDDAGVLRLRRTVTRTASSIPAMVLFALAPRQDAEALLACVVVGLGALLIGRTVALLPLLAAAVGAVVLSVGPASTHMNAFDFQGSFGLPSFVSPQLLGLFAAGMLAASLAPFAGPVGRFLRGRTN